MKSGFVVGEHNQREPLRTQLPNRHTRKMVGQLSPKTHPPTRDVNDEVAQPLMGGFPLHGIQLAIPAGHRLTACEKEKRLPRLPRPLTDLGCGQRERCSRSQPTKLFAGLHPRGNNGRIQRVEPFQFSAGHGLGNVRHEAKPPDKTRYPLTAYPYYRLPCDTDQNPRSQEADGRRRIARFRIGGAGSKEPSA